MQSRLCWFWAELVGCVETHRRPVKYAACSTNENCHQDEKAKRTNNQQNSPTRKTFAILVATTVAGDAIPVATTVAGNAIPVGIQHALDRRLLICRTMRLRKDAHNVAWNNSPGNVLRRFGCAVVKQNLQRRLSRHSTDRTPHLNNLYASCRSRQM